MMTIKGGTNKACAVCKYQRRRCSKECPLSPYFPADQPKKFSNAHRLFGVSNIMRILGQVSTEQKDEAMESIIFESDMRAKYPVHGCLGVIWNYEVQIFKAEQELRALKMQLSAIYKDHFHGQYHLPRQMNAPSQHLQSDHSLPIYNCLQHNNNGEFSMFDGNGVYSIESDENLMKYWSGQQAAYNVNANGNYVAAQGFSNQQELDIPADYDDIPFEAIADDRQSFIECKGACESSAESSFRDAKPHIEYVSENELKSAAACLTLTSVKG